MTDTRPAHAASPIDNYTVHLLAAGRLRDGPEELLLSFDGGPNIMGERALADPSEYLLPNDANEDDLSSWQPLVPGGARIIATNLFGDAFFVAPPGGVYMLERGAASLQSIAPSEPGFWKDIVEDAEGWQLRPLVDRCRSGGKILGEGQCYAFAVLPVLGGEYEPDNVWVASWHEWFALTADIYNQIKDVPDGTKVQLSFTEPSSSKPPTRQKSGFLGKLFSR